MSYSLYPSVRYVPVTVETNRRMQLTTIKTNFNKKPNNGGKQVSLADLIIIGGNAAIEKAAAAAGYNNISVPFTAGRVDATQDDTDISTFENLNPQGDGFRNYRNSSGWSLARTEELLVDKAQQLTLTAPELTALIGGLRAINANYDGSSNGILTHLPGRLTNDFFTNLLDITTVWTPDSTGELFTGKDRRSGNQRWTATRADLVFSSHAELRAIAEVYAEAGGQDQLVTDFVAAWAKVTNLDRFDVNK
jgi:catalase-peroxidase